MTAWLNFLTIDIIGDLSFSDDLGSLAAGEFDPRLQLIFASIKKSAFVKEVLRLPWLFSKVLITGLTTFMTWRGVSIGDIGADVMVKRRTKLELERPDFVSHMLKKTETKDAEYVCFGLDVRLSLLINDRMTSGEVDIAMTTLVVAGSETSKLHVIAGIE